MTTTLPRTPLNDLVARLERCSVPDTQPDSALPTLVVAGTREVAIITTRPLTSRRHRQSLIVGADVHVVAADTAVQRSLVRVYALGEPDHGWTCMFRPLNVLSPTLREATEAAMLAVETLPQRFRARADGPMNCARWCTHATAVPGGPTVHDRCTMQLTSLASLASAGQHVPLVFVDVHPAGKPVGSSTWPEGSSRVLWGQEAHDSLEHVLTSKVKGRIQAFKMLGRADRWQSAFAQAADDPAAQAAAAVEYAKAAMLLVAVVQAEHQTFQAVFVVRSPDAPWHGQVVAALNEGVAVHNRLADQRRWEARQSNMWQVGQVVSHPDAVDETTWETVLSTVHDRLADHAGSTVLVDAVESDLTLLTAGPTKSVLADFDALGMARLVVGAVFRGQHVLAVATRPSFRAACKPGLLVHAMPNLEGMHGSGYYGLVSDVLAAVKASGQPSVVFGASAAVRVPNAALPSMSVTRVWWCPNELLSNRINVDTADTPAEVLVAGQEYRLFCTVELDDRDWAASQQPDASKLTLALECTSAAVSGVHMRWMPATGAKPRRVLLSANVVLSDRAPFGNVLFWLKDNSGGVVDIVLPSAPAELHATSPYRLADIVGGTAPRTLPPPQQMLVLDEECKHARTRPVIKGLAPLPLGHYTHLQTVNQSIEPYTLQKSLLLGCHHEDPFMPVWRAMTSANPVWSLGFQMSSACGWRNCVESLRVARQHAWDWVRTMEILVFMAFARSDPSQTVPRGASQHVKEAAWLTDEEWATATEQFSLPAVAILAAQRLVGVAVHTAASYHGVDAQSMMTLPNALLPAPTPADPARCNVCDRAKTPAPAYHTGLRGNHEMLNAPSTIRVCRSCSDAIRDGHRTAFNAWNSPYNRRVEVILEVLQLSRQLWHTREVHNPIAKQVINKAGLQAVATVLASPVAKPVKRRPGAVRDADRGEEPSLPAPPRRGRGY